MDIKHFYIERGNGFPLILLHGNGGSSQYFRGQLDAFARAFHVYAIDTRGHGRTPRGRKPFTLTQFAEDLKDFMDIHHISKADILGFSDGGNIALIFAIRYPERVARLIVNGANISPSGIKRFSQLPVEIAYHMLKPVAGKIRIAHKFMELLSLMVNEPNITPEELGKIRAKTLVIAGTRDLIREQHTRLIAQSIPDARLVLLPGDHFIARKQRNRFNQVVLKFLLQKT
ncbi:alpha/beta fold hydrolase [Oribacterium sp. HCP28S3_H8]|uniref:alpha/beta fold hydrolase n=1 Tax=Oribacterium sp. HCP28S3_H8 TaxID=3438945 RepID=UPI003F8B268E